MAVGLPGIPTLYPVPGVRLGVAEAQIRYRGRADLVVFELVAGSTVAAMFTRNAFCAAPVQVARAHLAATAPRFLLVNAGNANAGTGRQGRADAVACCAALAAQRGCAQEAVLPFSTGVIGESLPVARLSAAIPQALAVLDPDGWIGAARAIMTTDTVPKGTSRHMQWGKRRYVITGIAKGAGMIRPDMATMLAFLATDAPIAQGVLQECLAEAVASTFNRITVDGDTSTNDACVLIATGRGGGPILTDRGGEPYRALGTAVQAVCTELAQAIVRDAEGATKFITVTVQQGRSVAECLQVGYSIAHSPLVKTAFFAADPNWGRILAAVGRAAVTGLDIEKVAIWLDDCCVVEGGERSRDYQEGWGRRIMAQSEITVRVDLGRGRACATLWTCDLSHQYVSINADYRT